MRPDGSSQRTLVSDLTWYSDCGNDLSWSPDSSRLAYAGAGVRGFSPVSYVAVVGIDGSEPRVLADHGFTPTWSPDGQTIAYGNDAYAEAPAGGQPLRPGVYLVPAAGGAPRLLTQATGSGCAFDEPQWSNDGTRIAFYGGSDGAHDVYVAQADGSGEIAIATDVADEYWPTWSPDDTRIAFDRVVLPTYNAPQFVLTDPDGENQVMLQSPPLNARFPTWSPDGRLLMGMTMNEDYTAITGLILVDVSRASAPVTIPVENLWADPAWQRLAP
jgi:Tol biopolymer transport system component